MRRKKHTILLYFSLLLLTIGSVIIVLGPYANFDEGGKKQTLAYLIGTVFWSCTLLGYIILFLTYRSCKKQYPSLSFQGIGLINFFKTKPAIIADIIFAVLLLVFLVLTLLKVNINDVISFSIIASMILTFQMRCIFNGKWFSCINKCLSEEKI